MKIAVTAATGKLGGAIIEQLKSDIGASNIIGLARTPSKGEHLGIEMRLGDYGSLEHFEEGLKGVDAVLIVSGMDKPENRIEQHRNIIKGAQKNGLKKMVYTSIVGAESGTSFSPVVASNRQTEEDVKSSGLDWVIGRNGIYIEPDLEYIDSYNKEGGIINCAGEGKCAYTSRPELAVAYSNMLREDHHNGETYNLVGEPITQQQLADKMNQVFGTNLIYKAISSEDYLKERKEALGDFIGTIIAGIYTGINEGVSDPESHFEKAAGRPHKSAIEIIKEFKT